MIIENSTPHHITTELTTPPAQLWIGQHEYALEQVELFLQKSLCPHNACQTCTACMHIRNKQHHAIMWFYPEKSYTVDMFQDLFSTIAYALEPQEKFFFVIQKANALTALCANKLLKSIEEPPAGYHFILISDHLENVLPTIISRCAVHTISKRTNNYTDNPLFLAFTHQYNTAAAFSKILDAAHINEQDSCDLFNELLNYWLKQTKECTPDHTMDSKNAIVAVFNEVHNKLPMPGSSITFWRNLYLMLEQHLKTLLQ